MAAHIRHSFAEVDESQHRCQLCGLVEEHDMEREVVETLTSGWDSGYGAYWIEVRHNSCGFCGYRDNERSGEREYTGM